MATRRAWRCVALIEWLLKLLKDHGCNAVILVQPDDRGRRKTDRRDAKRLSELLWLNQPRLASNAPMEGFRRVMIPTAEQRDDRRLTSLRQMVGQEITRAVNRIKGILRRHNLEQNCPTKGIQTKKAMAWLKGLPLSVLERLEMDMMLQRWEMLSKQRDLLEEQIVVRAQENLDAVQLRSLPGGGAYSALAIASRVGPIERFTRPRSLANYFGLTPSCRNSGEATRRLGSITKDGSPMVRFILGQISLHALRKDARMRDWYRDIKRRRGAKIAKVAVMRRLATIVWHMLARRETYRFGPSQRQQRRDQESDQRRATFLDDMRLVR